MFRHRGRAHIVPGSQTTRLIRVSAGTTPCCAEENRFVSSTRDVNLRFCSPKPEHRLRRLEDMHRSMDMEILYTNCAGLDIHKKTVKVCMLTSLSNGQPQKAFRTYFTTTEELLKLSDWLKEQGCTHIAFEATGVYSQPTVEQLSGRVEQLRQNAYGE